MVRISPLLTCLGFTATFAAGALSESKFATFIPGNATLEPFIVSPIGIFGDANPLNRLLYERTHQRLIFSRDTCTNTSATCGGSSFTVASNCCASAAQCCSGAEGGCCPSGSSCCSAGGGCCTSGTTCTTINGRSGCCPGGSICGSCPNESDTLCGDNLCCSKS
ncbi:hypothetical protein SCHPADRAFT_490338 [Schizopora paradoxa]|uniref:Uncharacterized protein n=1 Tax=Schizopora paradoxa TaxID=27342 RepID=A0A0H2S238_9AGAM|nr:hypothetical protein SCHPADRAFT_490338 [Schizopora paradoxa]